MGSINVAIHSVDLEKVDCPMDTREQTKGPDASLTIRANLEPARLEVHARFSTLEGREVYDVMRDGVYLTGGFDQREAAETIAKLFRSQSAPTPDDVDADSPFWTGGVA